jgi:penicillin-binding protein 2
VIVDPNNGDTLACVSYPGYDNNRLANTMDTEYYNEIIQDQSTPQYNYATRQKTAPGSTFKMLSSIAGLTEGVITPSDLITDLGVFDKASMSPKCWIYSSMHRTHGSINVSEALRDSCNYFFYEVGYRLASKQTGSYNDSNGIALFQKYISMFGLDTTTGIEIGEATPDVSDNDSVRTAIGQSTNSYTTTQIARYVATIANKGTCYNLTLLKKTTDSSGNTLQNFGADVYNKVEGVSESSWDAVEDGMKMVVAHLSTFDKVAVSVAGKTGTAQENKKRGNHALFVCYAPTESPQVAIATRIPYGYTSGNAAEVTSYIINYIFSNDEDSSPLGDAAGNTYVND